MNRNVLAAGVFVLGISMALQHARAQARHTTLADVTAMSPASMQELKQSATVIAQLMKEPTPTADFDRNIRAQVSTRGRELTPQEIDGMVHSKQYFAAGPAFLMKSPPSTINRLFGPTMRQQQFAGEHSVAGEQWRLAVIAADFGFYSFASVGGRSLAGPAAPGGGWDRLAKNKMTEGILSGTATCAMGNNNYQWNGMCHP